MSVEESLVANMDVDDSKKSFLMDSNKLRFQVYLLKQNPFRLATVCLAVLGLFLLAAVIGQSVNHSKAQKENTNRLQSVNAEKDSLQKSLTGLQKDKSKVDAKNNQLEETVDHMKTRKDQMISNYNSLAFEMSTVQENERALTSKNTALTKELQTQNATIARLQKDNDVLSTARDLFHDKLNQAVQLKNTLDENYKTVTAERNNLQNSVNNVTRSRDQLQLSYNNLMTQVESLEKRLHITTTEKDQAETGHMDATTAKNALQDMYNILVKATEQLNSTYNTLLTEKQELEKSCGAVRAERASLLEKNGNLTTERDQLHLEVIRLNATIASKRCPSGWQSYMFSCYYTSGIKKNWKNSRDFCKNKGADLAIITSQEEMNFINGLYSSDKEVWIGLSDDGIEGHWTWVDGTPLNQSVTFWGSGQPNSYDGRNQDCVEFWHRATGHGEWNDESCKIEQYWICEL